MIAGALGWLRHTVDGLRDGVGGLWELARLGLLTRFRFRGPYWRWRFETAIGRGKPNSRIELVRRVIGFGRWAYRMRRLSRKQLH